MKFWRSWLILNSLLILNRLLLLLSAVQLQCIYRPRGECMECAIYAEIYFELLNKIFQLSVSYISSIIIVFHNIMLLSYSYVYNGIFCRPSKYFLMKLFPSKCGRIVARIDLVDPRFMVWRVYGWFHYFGKWIPWVSTWQIIFKTGKVLLFMLDRLRMLHKLCITFSVKP